MATLCRTTHCADLLLLRLMQQCGFESNSTARRVTHVGRRALQRLHSPDCGGATRARVKRSRSPQKLHTTRLRSVECEPRGAAANREGRRGDGLGWKASSGSESATVGPPPRLSLHSVYQRVCCRSVECGWQGQWQRASEQQHTRQRGKPSRAEPRFAFCPPSAAAVAFIPSFLRIRTHSHSHSSK